jgi:hypothetical protein
MHPELFWKRVRNRSGPDLKQFEKYRDRAETQRAGVSPTITFIPSKKLKGINVKSRLETLIDRLVRLPSTLTLGALTAVGLVANWLATEWLNASYALSRFPVPYHTAQLSFDGLKIKAWYAQLIEWGTLDIYVQTQLIDHIFIATVFVLHAAALLWTSRLFPADHRGRRWMVIASLLSMAAPLADTLENLVSYAMLSNPSGFANGLALLYSSLAAVKFAMFTFAYIAWPIGIAAGLWVRTRRGKLAVPTA